MPGGSPTTDVATGGTILKSQIVSTNNSEPENDLKSLALDIVGKNEDATAVRRPLVIPPAGVSYDPSP